MNPITYCDAFVNTIFTNFKQNTDMKEAEIIDRIAPNHKTFELALKNKSNRKYICKRIAELDNITAKCQHKHGNISTLANSAEVDIATHITFIAICKHLLVMHDINERIKPLNKVSQELSQELILEDYKVMFDKAYNKYSRFCKQYNTSAEECNSVNALFVNIFKWASKKSMKETERYYNKKRSELNKSMQILDDVIQEIVEEDTNKDQSQTELTELEQIYKPETD